jgi:hypothetical protein
VSSKFELSDIVTLLGTEISKIDMESVAKTFEILNVLNIIVDISNLVNLHIASSPKYIVYLIVKVSEDKSKYLK